MMIKIASRMLLSAAAASMAVLPVVAQANTRAGDSGAIYSVSTPGVGRSAEGESIAGGAILLAIFAGAGIVAGALYAAGVIGEDDDEEGQSPGD